MATAWVGVAAAVFVIGGCCASPGPSNGEQVVNGPMGTIDSAMSPRARPNELSGPFTYSCTDHHAVVHILMGAMGHGHTSDEIIRKLRLRGLDVDKGKELEMRDAIHSILAEVTGRRLHLDIHENLSEDGLYSEGDIWVGQQSLKSMLLERGVVRTD